MAEEQVYLVGVLEGCYKIGRSGDSEKRLLSYSPKLPVTLTIHHRITTDNSPWLEKKMHIAFAHRRAVGEWFRLTIEDVNLFRSWIAIRQEDDLPPALSDLLKLNRGVRIDPVVDRGPDSTDNQATGKLVEKKAPTPPHEATPTTHADEPTFLMTFQYDYGYFKKGEVGMYKMGTNLGRSPKMVLLKSEPPTGAKSGGKWILPAIAYIDEFGNPREFIIRNQDDVDILNSGQDIFGRSDLDHHLGEVIGTFLPGALVDL